MGRSTYSQSVSASTRTFQTAAPSSEPQKPQAATKAKPQKDHKSDRRLTKWLAWLVIVGLMFVSLFLFTQYREAKAKLASPQAARASNKQLNDTLAKLTKIVILPANETPSVVTVADPTKLQNQSFFAHAKKGDKIIIYSQAKQAILYRPSTNQIVTMAPVTSPNK